MKFLGKYGEHHVLIKLLANDIEAYPAIKINQDSFDITAVLSLDKVVRIQVKTTELSNRSTNNQIGKLDRDFDFLVIVVIEDLACRFFVLTKEEALRLKGTDRLLSTSCTTGGVCQVRADLIAHEGKWEKIHDARPCGHEVGERRAPL